MSERLLPEGLERLKGNQGPLDQRELIMTAKRARACELRTAGYDYNFIGEELGVTANTARQLVQDALRITMSEAVDDMRLLDGARIENILRPLLQIAMDPSDRRMLSAIEKVVMLLERKHKMFGVDMPVEINVVEIRATLFGVLRDTLDPETYERVLQAAQDHG